MSYTQSQAPAPAVTKDYASTFLSEVPSYSIVSLNDPKTKSLAQCLRKNHETFAALRDPQLLFHNHMPHILGSSYYLGASVEKLEEICEAEGRDLRTVATVPMREPVTEKTWRHHLTDKTYTVSFVNFFDDEIRKAKGDWKKVANEYLYSASSPLINGFCGGLGHPFIHLHYAYEYDSAEVASEALSLGCTEYDFVHQYFDSLPPDTSTYMTKDLLQVHSKIAQDRRFDGQFNEPGFLNTFILHEKCENAILEHWNAWILEDYAEQFESVFDFAIRVAVETAGPQVQHDFFLIHILTTCHALRVILPHAPEEHRNNMVRQFVMWTIIIYCAQMRRQIGTGAIEAVDLDGRDWHWVQERSLNGKDSLDAHYVKVVRALKVGAELYGEKNGFYLKAAVKFVSEFKEWTGFGRGVEGMDEAVDLHPLSLK